MNKNIYFLLLPHNFDKKSFSVIGCDTYELIGLYDYNVIRFEDSKVLVRTLIEYLNPICALIIKYNKTISLFHGYEEIIPKNPDEIFRYLDNKINNMKMDASVYKILSDTKIDAYEFLSKVRDMYLK